MTMQLTDEQLEALASSAATSVTLRKGRADA
jgi:hypothetical protein